MIGKHVVIDTLDNFKTKLSLIPSSAIVLIKDVGQIYAHGTYFGAQKTYSLLTKTADGLAPKGGTSASSLIKDGETEWVLTVTNGENPSWRRLPDNAFNSLQYTLPAATTTELGGIKVGKLYTATFSDLVGKYYKINIDKDGLAYVEVPWTDNDYRVEQVNTSVLDEDFRVTFSGTAANDTKTETLRKSSKLLFNPVSGKLTSIAFEGNLDGKYVNKLTNYAIAKQEAAISANDSLNLALGKLEYKLDSAYNWYKGVIGTDEDKVINKWDEIVDFVKNVEEGTDLVDAFVTRKTDLTITGIKTFQNDPSSSSITILNGSITSNTSTWGGWARAIKFSNTDTNSAGETTSVSASFGVHGIGGGLQHTGSNIIRYLYMAHYSLDHDTAVFKVYNNKATISDNEIYHKGNLKNLSDLNDDVVSGNYLPLTGGTLTGNLDIKDAIFSIFSNKNQIRLIPSNNSEFTYIESGNSDFTENAPLKITGYNGNTGSDLYLNFNNIYCRGNLYENIDSGNVYDYCVKSNLGGIVATKTNMNEVGYGYSALGWYGSGPAIGFGATNGYTMLMLLTANTYRTFVSYKTPEGTINPWKEIAFVDGTIENANKLNNYTELDFFRYRGNVKTSYIDTTSYENGNPDFETLNPGMYTIQRANNSEMLISFAKNSGSCSSLELRTLYEHDTFIYARKIIDKKRISGPWKALAFTDSTVENSKKLEGLSSNDFVRMYLQERGDETDDYLNLARRAYIRTSFLLDGQGDFCSLVLPTWRGNGSIYYLSEVRFPLGNSPKFRTSKNGTVTTEWREFAFIDSDITGNAATATDAHKLDGYHLSDIPYAVNSGNGLGTSEESGRADDLNRTLFFRDNTTKGGIIGYNVLHSQASTYGMLLVTTYVDKLYYIRTKVNGVWKDWNELALTSGNVESANKLKTPVSIWGNSFDGTSNITGNLLLGSKTIFVSDEESNNYNALHLYTQGLYLGMGTSDKYNTMLWGKNIGIVTGTNGAIRVYVTNAGNVGIGIDKPEYKLDVNGSSRFGNVETSKLHITSNAFEVLTVERTGENLSAGIHFKNARETMGYIGMNSTSSLLRYSPDTNTKYKIWDEGNHGAGSGLNADLLDGIHANEFFLSRGFTGNNLNFDSIETSGIWCVNSESNYSNYNQPFLFGNVLTFTDTNLKSSYGRVQIGVSNSSNFYYRSIWDAKWGNWERLLKYSEFSSEFNKEYSKYSYYDSQRDFSDGTLIKTDIDYSQEQGNPFYGEIKGNTYTKLGSMFTLFLGYIYNNSIINYSISNLGIELPEPLTAMNIDGYLCFWFPRRSYWLGYAIKITTGYNHNINRVISVSNSTKPNGTKVVEFVNTPDQLVLFINLNNSNYHKYTVRQDGTGAYGNWAIKSQALYKNTALSTSLDINNFLWSDGLAYTTFSNYPDLGFLGNDGILATLAYSANYGVLLAFDDSNNNFKLRSRNSEGNSWRNWSTIIHSDNIALYMNTVELISNITTILKDLTVTQDWMDTGIRHKDLTTGTYIVQVYVNAEASSMYDCYWSGIMSWYSGKVYSRTNDTETDEILLHRSGHAYGNTIYLRTAMSSTESELGLRLQIAANKNIAKLYSYKFTFKKII